VKTSVPLTVTAFCLGILVAAPARSATLTESQLSGYVTGEALCSLARQGAPKEILREEFARLTKKATDRDTLDLRQHGDAYLGMVELVMKACPERGLPDA
jgi:hypothetical protein